MRYAYPCLITASAYADGGFTVSFPGVKGAHTGGDTYTEAHFQAHDCLVAALGAYVRCEEDLPIPSPIKAGQELIPVPPMVATKLSIYTAMRRQGVSYADLAGQLGLQEASIKKLVHPDCITPWSQVTRALDLLGCRLVVEDLAA